MIDYYIGISNPIKWTGPIIEHAGKFHRDEEVLVKTLIEFGGRWEPSWSLGQQLPVGRAFVPHAQVKASAAALRAKGYTCSLPEEFR